MHFKYTAVGMAISLVAVTGFLSVPQQAQAVSGDQLKSRQVQKTRPVQKSRPVQKTRVEEECRWVFFGLFRQCKLVTKTYTDIEYYTVTETYTDIEWYTVRAPGLRPATELHTGPVEMERSANPFLSPAQELAIMQMIPVCHPSMHVVAEGNRLKCGPMPVARTCPAGQVMVGLTGDAMLRTAVNCKTLAQIPPPPSSPTSTYVGNDGRVYSSVSEANFRGGGVDTSQPFSNIDGGVTGRTCNAGVC